MNGAGGSGLLAAQCRRDGDRDGFSDRLGWVWEIVADSAAWRPASHRPSQTCDTAAPPQIPDAGG